MCKHEISAVLLNWYDQNARALPWRVSPAARNAGIAPEPYRVWLSEVMLQQTTVATVKDYYQRFITRWPTVCALADANDADVMAAWAGLGYYARARNMLKCARIICRTYDGVFPHEYDELLNLPGIGAYTAGAVATIAFGRPETVVDGNVERVLSRLKLIRTPLPKSKSEIHYIAKALTPADRPGDYVQAVMDLGATICTPKRPVCDQCPLASVCLANAAGLAGELPRRLAKARKPTRHGIAYVVQRSDGAWLLERRPDRGLLGGMLGWPGSHWDDAPRESPPVDANWRNADTEVRHTFTHFHLRLTVRAAVVGRHAVPTTGHFVSAAEFQRSDLPTAMRKVFDVAAFEVVRD